MAMNGWNPADKFDDTDDDRTDDIPLVLNLTNHTSNKNVTCAELLELNPAIHGAASKKNNSYLAYFFPWFFELWKERYFVLLGNYLFRFSSIHGESVKGVPIPLDCVTVKKLDDCCLEVSTLRKVYQIRMSSDDEAHQWVAAIKKRKLEAIRENMGHVSLSTEIKRTNKIGAYLFNKRLEIDRLVARSSASSPLDPMNQSEFTMQ